MDIIMNKKLKEFRNDSLTVKYVMNTEGWADIAKLKEELRKVELQRKIMEILKIGRNFSVTTGSTGQYYNRKLRTELASSFSRDSKRSGDGHPIIQTISIVFSLLFFLTLLYKCGVDIVKILEVMLNTREGNRSDSPGSDASAPGTESPRSHPAASNSTSEGTAIHIRTNENNEGHQSGEDTTGFHLPTSECNRPSVSLNNIAEPYVNSDRNESETDYSSIENRRNSIEVVNLYRQLGGSTSRINDSNLVAFDMPPSYHTVLSSDLSDKTTKFPVVFNRKAAESPPPSYDERNIQVQ